MNWLALAVVLTLGPVFRIYPLWITLVCLAITAFSLLGKWKGWLLKFVAIASALGVFIQYGTFFTREAGMALLALLVCLKLMESEGRGDASLVVFLCFFLIMTWFFDSQAMPVAAAMLFMLVFLTANLIRINGAASFLQCMGSAVLLLFQALPFALLLFLLFPRIPGPIWALPRDAGHGESGLSDTLSPGSISNLALSDEVAFRVEFGSKMPERAALYWRGPVLWDYDGKTWSVGRAIPSAYSLHVRGGLTNYEVMLEPSGRNWLFALDMPLSHPVIGRIASDGQIVAAVPVKARVRYAVTSALNYEAGLAEPESNLEEATRLPASGNPKSRMLAQSWKGESPEEVARHATAFYREHRFVYTLTPPLLQSDEVDDFLFRTRSGFCEHYASSFAFLMRAAGVPARIVTGYQGGEVNPIGHYLTVRQADAHAWVEIWEKDKGWVRIDPTAIAAPVRVESSVRTLPVLMGGGMGSLRFGWDAALNAWNQWVVGFGEEKQKRLFGGFGMEGATLKDIAAAFSFAVAAVFLAATGFLLIRVKSVGEDRVQQIYLLFCRKMKRMGIERKMGEGPLDFGGRIASARPEMASRVFSIVRLYSTLRYGKDWAKEEVARFSRLVKSL